MTTTTTPIDPNSRNSITRTKHTVPNQRTETLRNRLEMSTRAFSVAVGLSAGAYSTMLTRNAVPETVALAAEALVKRQAQGDTELMFLVRVFKGVAQTTLLTRPYRTLILDNKKYTLVAIEG